jgi:hypothetical protein
MTLDEPRRPDFDELLPKLQRRDAAGEACVSFAFWSSMTIRGLIGSLRPR